MHRIVEFITPKQAPYERLAAGLADTPVGPAVLAWDRIGIRSLSFSNKPSDSLVEWLGSEAERDDRLAQQIVSEAFAGQPLSAPLVLSGTAFQCQVWRELMRLKVGQTISYSELASRLDKPSAARAVGSAVGANRLGFLVPCHRVVRRDGIIGLFRWGTEIKASLLAWEQSRSVHE